MFRKLFCAMIVMAVGIGFAVAEEFTASITKVDGDKVTYQKYKKFEFKKPEKDKKPDFKGPEKDGDAVTLTVAKDAKITKAKFNLEDKKWESAGAIEDGLKNDLFKIEEPKDKKGKFGFGAPGLNAQITTSEDGKTITAIEVRQFGGKGFKDKKKVEKDK
jgi:hypothetical protein